MPMNFEETTARFLEMEVCAPGHKADGKTIAEALPGMGKARIWGATYGGYSWSIVYEPGLPEWDDEERRKHVGYSATYRRVGQYTSNETIHVDGAPWPSFAAAKDACRRVWGQIKSPN